jgi:hypothetical protein
MEILIFKHKGQVVSKRIVGVFWILFGISALLFLSDEPLTILEWIRSMAYILIGFIFFTPLVGHKETRFEVGNDNLKIKWLTKIREIIIMDNEIEKIILKNKKIEIQRKEKNAVVLSFGEWLWRVEDKTKVYQFMIEYARLKNLVLER